MSIPVSAPKAIGVKVMLTLQLFFAASVAPQVFAEIAKSPLGVMLLISSVSVMAHTQPNLNSYINQRYSRGQPANRETAYHRKNNTKCFRPRERLTSMSLVSSSVDSSIERFITYEKLTHDYYSCRSEPGKWGRLTRVAT